MTKQKDLEQVIETEQKEESQTEKTTGDERPEETGPVEETKAETETGGVEEAAGSETTETTEPAETIEATAATSATIETGESPPEAEATAEAVDEQPEESKELSLEEQLERANQEAAENLDRWQRAVAELANFKRRQEEQRKLQRDRIKAEVLEGVISALDDMVIAFQHVPEDLDGQVVGWVEGFRLVQRKLDKILDDQNVMPINTEGVFDPNLHEAVSYEENENHADGEIIEELRRGYQIGNRVIRPALVRVAK